MLRSCRMATSWVWLMAAIAPALSSGGCWWTDELHDQERSGPGSAAPFEARLEAAFRELEARKMPVIVAISHQGGEVITREFGALAEDGIAAAETQLDLNSITKTITGVMAAKLVEQGKARFDETLAQIFGSVPADKAEITLHQLLTHAAGLSESVGEDFERLGRAQFLERVFASALISPPGELYHYSNTGFGVVAAIIEQRAGKSYEAFLREDVIGGLGLDDMGYASVYDDTRSLRTARGRSVAEASWGGGQPYWNLIGNGGLISTAVDFIHFRRALSRGDVISSDMLARVQAPQIAEDEGTGFYGYGVVVQDVAGIGRVYRHDGGNGLFSAQWVDYADQGDLVFTAAVDSKRGDAFEAALVIAQHLYDYDAASD